VYQVEDLELGKHPIPGLQHVTLHGGDAHARRYLLLYLVPTRLRLGFLMLLCGASCRSASGFRQHGMRGFEVLQQTLAPGVATPVHEHNCQEVFLVLSGQATAAIRGKVSSAACLLRPVPVVSAALQHCLDVPCTCNTSCWAISVATAVASMCVSINHLHACAGWQGG
jgi:mannose-6-phosphate isomerase-like protein (cupin superfamily)